MKILFANLMLFLAPTIMGQNFHTFFRYDDSLHKGISISNSYPKGGQRYTAPDGKEYLFVVFWTQILNESDTDLTLSIEFPKAAFTVPSSPDVHFNLYLPTDEMTIVPIQLWPGCEIIHG